MDAAAVNLNLLVALDALLDARSVTGAARRIGLSQPATSHALAQLRAIYGDPLLVRAPGGLAPTPLAEALAPAVRAALRDVRAVLAARVTFDPATATRRFRIAASDAIAVLALDGLVRALARHAPGCELVVRPAAAGTERALAGGEIDVLLASPEQLPQTGALARERLFVETWSVLARRALGRIDLERFCTLGHALVTSDEEPGLVDRALAKRRRARRVVVRVPDFAALGPLLAHTDLVATIPARLAARLAPPHRLAIHAPPIALPRFDVLMTWHPRFDADPASRWLRAQVTRVAGDLVGPDT